MTRKELNELLEIIRTADGQKLINPEGDVLKTALDAEGKVKAAEIEANSRLEIAKIESEDAKKGRIATYICTGVSGAISIAGLVLKAIMFREGLQFEETGVYTSVMTKSMAQDAVRGDGTKKF